MPAFILHAVFVVSLLPYSIVIADNGVSANYFYVLLPLILAFVGIKRRIVPRPLILRAVAVYGAIYLVGFAEIFDQSYALESETRRLASFWVFLFPLILSFIEFKPSDIDVFKRSVILVALYASLTTMSSLSASNVALFELKGQIGSQRFGFVLCLGFFLVLFNERPLFDRLVLLQRLVFGSILAAGMSLTFSRATLVAALSGLAFGIVATPSLVRLRGRSPRSRTREGYSANLFRLTAAAAVIALVVVGFQIYTGTDLVEFYAARFFRPLADMTLWRDTLRGEINSSEGYRTYVLARIFDYVAVHPLAGSSFRGLYLLYDEFSAGASTHNQYSDVILRTGLVGGAMWLYLLYRVVRFSRIDKGLQLGVVSILVYGLFHETFKLSQGSFIFGMLLSFSFIALPAGAHAALAARAPIKPRPLPEPPPADFRGGWASPPPWRP